MLSMLWSYYIVDKKVSSPSGVLSCVITFSNWSSLDSGLTQWDLESGSNSSVTRVPLLLLHYDQTPILILTFYILVRRWLHWPSTFLLRCQCDHCCQAWARRGGTGLQYCSVKLQNSAEPLSSPHTCQGRLVQNLKSLIAVLSVWVQSITACSFAHEYSD